MAVGDDSITGALCHRGSRFEHYGADCQRLRTLRHRVVRRAYGGYAWLGSADCRRADARRGDESEKLILSSGAQKGDDLILTKGLGIEATSIIARERESELAGKYSAAFLARAKEHLTSPGISVLKDALTAADAGGVNAMHDPTEGGVATAVHELCRAARLGAVVREKQLFLSEEARVLCTEFELNPLGVISSGALLIAAAPTGTREIVDALGKEGIVSGVIGEFQDQDEGVWLEKENGERPAATNLRE